MGFTKKNEIFFTFSCLTRNRWTIIKKLGKIKKRLFKIGVKLRNKVRIKTAGK